MLGGNTSEIQIWTLQEGRTGRFSLVHRILLVDMTTAEDPGVYEFIVTGSVPVQEGDVVSVYENMSSSLELYNERDAGIYRLSIPIDEGNGNTLPPDDDWPLLSIKTGNNTSCSVDMSRDALCVCHKHMIVYTKYLQVQPVTVVLSKEREALTLCNGTSE